MDSVRNRTEAQTVLALRKTNGILNLLLEDYPEFIGIHERKNILKTIEQIEEQVLYENEENWLFGSLKMISHAREVFRAFESISIKMGWDDMRLCMILSEAQLLELENQIKMILKISITR
jgi:hypothetical protein